MNALGTTRCLNDENVSVSINQTLFIKHLKKHRSGPKCLYREIKLIQDIKYK